MSRDVAGSFIIDQETCITNSLMQRNMEKADNILFTSSGVTQENHRDGRRETEKFAASTERRRCAFIGGEQDKIEC
eukprot:3348634-Amphidinium_carterae.5